MEVGDTVKRCVLFLMCVLCMALPQGALAESGVTVLFSGDLVGQITPMHG